MKNLGNLVAAIGMLMFVYSVAARFISSPTIGFGLIEASASSGILTANGIMLIGLIIREWGK